MTMAIDGISLAALPSGSGVGRSVGQSASPDGAPPAPVVSVSSQHPPHPRRDAITDLSRQLESINRALRERQSDLSFSVDESTGKTVVRVVRETTGELVRQIPSEEVLAIANALRSIEHSGALGVEAFA